jgi:hypothetical protein
MILHGGPAPRSLPGLLRAEGRIAVVYVERELVPPAVRAFVDWLLARAPSALAAARARAQPKSARRRARLAAGQSLAES